jgi:outer membrane protein assembly factor BamA
MDLVLAASVKSGPTGAELAQQDYSFNWDIPGAFDGKVRLNPSVLFQRTINYGYFGIGNASTGVRPANATGVPGRYNQYIQTEARVRMLTRFATHGAWNPVLVTMYRFEDPRSYAGSELATDVATRNADGSPLVRGLHPMSVVTLGGGAIYDTRDNEFLPKSGQFHQLGLRFHEAFPWNDGVRYGHASTIFAGYVPINHSVNHPMTFAARAVLDAEFGHVPFFDMSTAGPFITNDMPGGAEGVRGVPLGRYYGPLKAIGNVEVRTMLFKVRLLSQAFHIGNSVFFDTGRVWSDYTFTNARDGHGLGLKWGSGIGAILQWGQAAVFRVDAAYSPDALSANPGFPIGLYVSDGVMF